MPALSSFTTAVHTFGRLTSNCAIGAARKRCHEQPVEQPTKFDLIVNLRPRVALSKLHHVIDLEWMKEAYRLTRKDGAPGIDDVTADDYAINLDANLLDLLDRIKSGHYKAPPAGGLPWLASA